MEKTEQFITEGWIRLKEPRTAGAAILWALPLSMAMILINCTWCYFLYSPLRGLVDGETELMIEFSVGPGSLLYILAVILFLLVHEMIHGLFIPNVWHSKKTFWGFHGAYGFVYTQEVISKGRFLLISIMPFAALSFAFPFLMSVMGRMNGFILFLSLLNAGGSCVDLLNMLLISFQVPGRGRIVSNGFATFYK